MSGIELSVTDWLALLSHIKKWLSNLSRASDARKQESKTALREVIKAVRQTTVYVRGLNGGEKKSVRREGELSLLWTELSFRLEDLGLHKLAKRCRIKGVYWADPGALDKDFLHKADVRLSDIERLALQSLKDLQ